FLGSCRGFCPVVLSEGQKDRIATYSAGMATKSLLFGVWKSFATPRYRRFGPSTVNWQYIGLPSGGPATVWSVVCWGSSVTWPLSKRRAPLLMIRTLTVRVFCPTFVRLHARASGATAHRVGVKSSAACTGTESVRPLASTRVLNFMGLSSS